MTDPQHHEVIQRLEHKKRLLEMRLQQGEDLIKAQILKNGEFRTALQHIENDVYRIFQKS